MFCGLALMVYVIRWGDQVGCWFHGRLGSS